MVHTPQFFLPNASVNKYYAHKPQLRVAYKYPLVVADIDLHGVIGLAFDHDSGELIGQPIQAGEFKATIYYYETVKGERAPIKSMDVILLINPDPRSLWKNLPSSPDALYAKADSASQHVLNEYRQIVALAASLRGRAHAHKGQARDDDFFVAFNSGWHVAIVADGAGSAKYSRHGSHLACQVAGAFLQRELAGEYGEIITKSVQTQQMPDLNLLCQTLLANAAARAVQAIEAEALSQPDTAPRDFATTLLMTVTRPDIVPGQDLYFSYSVGDGVMALYQPGQTLDILSVGDGGEFAGQTRFLAFDALSDGELAKRCQTRVVPAGHVLLLMTDGVSDPFFDNDQQLHQRENWDAFWHELQQQHALNSEQQLLQWLEFWSAGHHDDRTIIIVPGAHHA